MTITFNEKGGSKVAIIESDELVLTDVQSALDLLATVRHAYDCDKILLQKKDVCDDFFNLKTKLAGKILQKFTNYSIKIAIVGDFSNITSKALRDFITESNRGKQTFFVATNEEALKRLHQFG